MDDKLEGKRLKEKRRVIKISEAYRKLYTVLKFDDATKRKVSRNALLRAAIDYINTLQSRTDMVSRCTIHLGLDGLCTARLAPVFILGGNCPHPNDNLRLTVTP